MSQERRVFTALLQYKHARRVFTDARKEILMDFDETMVDQDFDETADDTPEQLVEEETDESEDLDSLINEEGEVEEEEPVEEPEPQPQATEPGWIKKRVEKAVSRAVAETEARMQALFDQQMAPIKARMMEDEAQELVRSRKVTDIETARELVRLRNGQPAQAQSQEETPQQPRQANGQFAPKQDPGTSARIEMLRHQADAIQGSGGPDVIKEFMDNEEIKQAVVKGEMDFYDVAAYLKEQKASRKRPPSPMRSPNGASGQSPNAIDSMSDEQFERMEKRISEGARIRLSK